MKTLIAWLMLVAIGTAQQFEIVSIEQPAVVAIEQAKPAQRQWYLVSEPSWCRHCPAAHDLFISKGWPESNVLTLDECEARFGFRPDHVPFEFGEPEKRPKGTLTRRVQVQPQRVRWFGGGRR